MSFLIVVGYILAVLNPVIGGVLVGYIVWLSRPEAGFPGKEAFPRSSSAPHIWLG